MACDYNPEPPDDWGKPVAWICDHLYNRYHRNAGRWQIVGIHKFKIKFSKRFQMSEKKYADVGDDCHIFTFSIN